MLVLDFGVGRTEVAEAMCSDTRVLRGVLEELVLELEGRGTRLVGLGFEEPVKDWVGGSTVGRAGSCLVDFVTYVFVHRS